MFDFEQDAPDAVNTLENKHLQSAIRAVVFSDSRRNFDAFLKTFLESTVLILLQRPVHEEDESYDTDGEGFETYHRGTVLPVVQLDNQLGERFLPAFTKADFVHCIPGLENFQGFAIQSLDLLEMIEEAGSDVLILNPGSNEELSIHADSLKELVKFMREQGILKQRKLFEKTPRDIKSH